MTIVCAECTQITMRCINQKETWRNNVHKSVFTSQKLFLAPLSEVHENQEITWIMSERQQGGDWLLTCALPSTVERG